MIPRKGHDPWATWATFYTQVLCCPLWYWIQRISTLKMADVHCKITFKSLAQSLCPKHQKSCKLWSKEAWESECSSDSDVDKVSLMNRSVTLPLVSCLHKEIECSINSDAIE